MASLLDDDWIVLASEVHRAPLVVVEVAVEKPQCDILGRRCYHLAGDLVGPLQHLPLALGLLGRDLFRRRLWY